MDNLTIRKATMQDIPAIFALYRDAQIDGDGGFTIEEATEHLAPSLAILTFTSLWL